MYTYIYMYILFCFLYIYILIWKTQVCCPWSANDRQVIEACCFSKCAHLCQKVSGLAIIELGKKLVWGPPPALTVVELLTLFPMEGGGGIGPPLCFIGNK